jgi:hypothetical protein
MLHPDRMREANTDESNGDRLLSQFPILGLQCPESIIRLARFDREQWILDGLRWRSEGPIDKTGIDEHARRLLGCVQSELASLLGFVELGPSLLEIDAAIELSASRKLALEALRRIGANTSVAGNTYAKTVQAAVSPGPPLAICTGSGYVRRVETVLGNLPFKAIGCLAIFEDSTRVSGGKMWPVWCPPCRPRNGIRQPARDQVRALRRRAKEIAEGRRRMTDAH